MHGIGRQKGDDQHRNQVQRHHAIGRLRPPYQPDERQRHADDQERQRQSAGDLNHCLAVDDHRITSNTRRSTPSVMPCRKRSGSSRNMTCT